MWVRAGNSELGLKVSSFNLGWSLDWGKPRVFADSHFLPSGQRKTVSQCVGKKTSQKQLQWRERDSFTWTLNTPFLQHFLFWPILLSTVNEFPHTLRLHGALLLPDWSSLTWENAGWKEHWFRCCICSSPQITSAHSFPSTQMCSTHT